MRTPENVEQNALPTALTRPAVYFRKVFNPQFCSHVEIREYLNGANQEALQAGLGLGCQPEQSR